MAASLCQTGHISGEELEWEALMQFEHVDWNDIIDAEMSGNSDALLLLKKKSKAAREVARDQVPSSSDSSPSYAQILKSPHGIKRTTSERIGLSPCDYCPKRSAVDQMVSTQHTPPNSALPSSNETPDFDALCSKANSGAVQRRLFASPKTEPVEGNSGGGELTSHRLQQRQKQVDFGKNTIGYQRYIQMVPRWERNSADPVTPDKHKPVSTRAWQGQIRLWRRGLHVFDPPTEDAFTSAEASLCDM